MKSAKFFIALFCFCSFLFINCSPNQEMVPTTREILTQGNWKVDHFNNGQDVTTQYSDFHFQFKTNGNISCIHSSGDCEGMWNVDPNNVLQIQLHSQDAAVQQLVKDWKVISADLTTLNLQLNNTQLRLRKL